MCDKGPCRCPLAKHFQHNNLHLSQDPPKEDWIFTTVISILFLFHCLTWPRPFLNTVYDPVGQDLGSHMTSFFSSWSFYFSVRLRMGVGSQIIRKKNLTLMSCFHYKCDILIIVVLIQEDEYIGSKFGGVNKILVTITKSQRIKHMKSLIFTLTKVNMGLLVLFQVVTQGSRLLNLWVIIIINMHSAQLPLHEKKEWVAHVDLCVGSEVAYITLIHIISQQ